MNDSGRAGAYESRAVFSDCRKYRYELWRVWNEELGIVAFIGLNPSTADEINDDPTVKRCCEYARLWKYGGICMLNLFSFRATNPEKMLAEADPIGSENDATIARVVSDAEMILICPGNLGQHGNRFTKVVNSLKQHRDKVCYLKLNKSMLPAHPLYLSKSLRPKKWWGEGNVVALFLTQTDDALSDHYARGV